MDEFQQNDQFEEKIHLDQELLWEDYEYDFQEKSSEWFWILGTIAILAVIISIIIHNYLFALLILIASFILGTQAKRIPSLISFGLTKDGIKFGHTVFHYNTIRSFWIDERSESLIIESSRLVKPHIHIPLKNTDKDHVKELLSSILKQKEYQHSFSDFVTEFFGF